MIDRAVSPPELARRLGIKAEKVIGWIASGELPALNVAQKKSGRPRWRITPEGWQKFEESRSSVSPVTTHRRRRRRSAAKHYFR